MQVPGQRSDDPLLRALSGTGYSAPFADARDAWNGKSIPGVFTKTTSAGQSKLDVTRGTYAADWWGVTIGSCSNGLWVEPVDMYFHDGQMYELTSTQRTLVMEHELGHAYGLDHMPDGCSTPAVMVQGDWRWICNWLGSPPWNDDLSGVRYVY